MKAVFVTNPGGPESLDYIDVPKPAPGPRDILIRTGAFGVGQPDVLLRKGIYKWMPPLPVNPGNDAAGWVEAVGAEVTSLRIGQKVLLSARDLPQRGGCYAEYIVAPADAVHALADDVDLETAVCLSNYQVGYALLHEAAGSKPARSVLIVGAAGGVGSAMVQLAKLAGMRVIGTVSSQRKADFARQMGADGIIFYRTENVIERVLDLTGGKGVDLVLDYVCGPEFTSYLRILDKWGTIISYNAFSGLPEENLIGEMRNHLGKCPGVRAFSFHIYDDDRDSRRRLMGTVIRFLEEGGIKPAIHSRLHLSEVRKAHELLDSGEALGKIVMTT